MLQITGHAFDLGLLGAVSWAPMLLGGAYAGALVDRWDRRRLLIVTQLAFLVIGVGQAALVATGAIELWMIYVLGGLTGVVMALDSPARQVYVLELVGRERLVSAVSLYEVILNASRVIGPGVGGLLLATLGVSWCFAVNALSFLAPLLVLLRYRPTAQVASAQVASADVAPVVPVDPVAPDETGRGGRRAGSGALAGVRISWRSPVIRSCLLVAVAGGLLFNLGIALLVLATRVLHLGGGGYGLLMSAFGLGAIPGALVAAGTGAPSGAKVRVLAVLSGAIVLATAAAPGPVPAFIGLAAAGFASIWLISVANTLVQLRAEPALAGRVMGVWGMALPGTVPFTGLLTSAVTQEFGGRAGFGLAGVALLAAGLGCWWALADRGAANPAVPGPPTTPTVVAAPAPVLESVSTAAGTSAGRSGQPAQAPTPQASV